jgi:hypothetical protein
MANGFRSANTPAACSRVDGGSGEGAIKIPVRSSLEAVNASADFSRTSGCRSQLHSYETQGTGWTRGPPKDLEATHRAVALLTLELTRCRPLPGATPNVHNAHDFGGLIDREEHAVNARAPAVVESANWLIRVEALWRYSESLWDLLQRENCSLETVEPG